MTDIIQSQYMDPASNKRARGSGGRPRPGLKFINTAHPSDATSYDTIRQIRSHVAKDIHARGRRSKAAVAAPSIPTASRARSHESEQHHLESEHSDEGTSHCSCDGSCGGHDRAAAAAEAAARATSQAMSRNPAADAGWEVVFVDGDETAPAYDGISRTTTKSRKPRPAPARQASGRRAPLPASTAAVQEANIRAPLGSPPIQLPFREATPPTPLRRPAQKSAVIGPLAIAAQTLKQKQKAAKPVPAVAQGNAAHREYREFSVALAGHRNTTLGAGRKDPFQIFARPLSDMESSLIDHYMYWSSPKSWSGECPIGHLDTHLWIAFALNDVGCLNALLLQGACSLSRFPGNWERYTGLVVHYKGLCLKSTQESLASRDTMYDDNTVSKMLVLAAEEWIEGNFDTWTLHLDAVTRIVRARGGPASLGVGGFLASAYGRILSLHDAWQKDQTSLSWGEPIDTSASSSGTRGAAVQG